MAQAIRTNVASRRGSLPQKVLHGRHHRRRLVAIELRAGGGDTCKAARVETAEQQDEDLGRELQKRQWRLVLCDFLTSRGATASRVHLVGCEPQPRRV